MREIGLEVRSTNKIWKTAKQNVIKNQVAIQLPIAKKITFAIYMIKGFMEVKAKHQTPTASHPISLTQANF